MRYIRLRMSNYNALNSIKGSKTMTEQVKVKPLNVESSTVLGYLKSMLGIGDGVMGDFLQQYKVLDKKAKDDLRDYAIAEMEYYGIEIEQKEKL